MLTVPFPPEGMPNADNVPNEVDPPELTVVLVPTATPPPTCHVNP
jgi:hypothetical protein